MLYQKQTIFTDHEKGLYGNCLQACIANLLELPLSEVPHFVTAQDSGDSVDFKVISIIIVFSFFQPHTLIMNTACLNN